MTLNDIVNELSRNKAIETIISNISKGRFDNTEDLSQDLYLKLLEKPEDKIVKMYNDNQLNYFLTKMVWNNLFSPRSDYYYDYKRYSDKKNDISTIIDKI